MFAQGEVLKSIARERGIDDSLGEEEIRRRLFEKLELEEVTLKVEETVNDDNKYKLEIINADNLRQQEGTTILEGNVSISF